MNMTLSFGHVFMLHMSAFMPVHCSDFFWSDENWSLVPPDMCACLSVGVFVFVFPFPLVGPGGGRGAEGEAVSMFAKCFFFLIKFDLHVSIPVFDQLIVDCAGFFRLRGWSVSSCCRTLSCWLESASFSLLRFTWLRRHQGVGLPRLPSFSTMTVGHCFAKLDLQHRSRYISMKHEGMTLVCAHGREAVHFAS